LVIAVNHPFVTVLVYLVSVELEGFEKEHGEVEKAREWWILVGACFSRTLAAPML
jgi:hypothetical protein